MRNLIIAIIMAVFAIPANAQLKWGIEAGLNMNKLTTRHMKDHSLGFFIGPKVQYSLLGFIIDGSLQYSQSKLEVDDIKSKTMPYIVIPVNFKYAIGLGSVASLYVSTGPQWNWYVGKQFTYTDAAHHTYDYNFKNHTFNWNIGVGAHLFKHLQAGLTYSIAMQKNATIFENTKEVFNGRNNLWQVRLAYMF